MPVSISGDGSIGGLELGAFEDVSGTPTDNQALTWDEATGQWVPETVTPTSLDASIIDSGTLDVARVPNLAASKVTSGVFDAARIPDVANAGIGSNVVGVAKTNVFSTTSTSPTTVTGLTVTITPTSATSKILLIAQLAVGWQNNAQIGHWLFSGGNTSGYIGNAASSHSRAVFGGRTVFDGSYLTPSHPIMYLDSPATTSPVTYNVQAFRGSSESATVYLNRAATGFTGNRITRGASSFVAIEVAA